MSAQTPKDVIEYIRDHDIRMVDIAHPWSEGPAGVCEVNAGPGIDNIAVRADSRRQGYGSALLDHLRDLHPGKGLVTEDLSADGHDRPR